MEDNYKNIIIDEQDLFNFVFYPDLLSENKRKKILNDESLSDVIEFYKQLKSNSARELSNSLKKAIAKKIPVYSFVNVITLYPLKVPQIVKKEKHRLAARSVDLAPKMTTKTFIDNEKEYMIKVMSYEKSTKIFVFSTNDEVVNNFDITIEPQNLKYHFDDNSEPLQLDQVIEVEKIQLSFSK